MTATASLQLERPKRRSAKREIILAEAVELFLDVGYGSASINLLVDRVGGSKSTVYAHFENKEKLFEAVVEKIVGEVTSSLADLEPSGLDLRRGLQLIGERLLDLVMSRRHIGLARLVIAEAGRFPEVGRIYYHYGPGLTYKELEEFLDEHRLEGNINIDDPTQAADFFGGMLLHQWTFRRFCIDPEPPTKKEIRARVLAVVDQFIRTYSRVSSTAKE